MKFKYLLTLRDAQRSVFNIRTPLIFFLSACFSYSADRLHVAATHPFIQEWVEIIGGEDVSCVWVTEHDSKDLQSVSLIYETGLGAEPWLDAALAELPDRPRRVILSDGIPHLTEGEAYWMKMGPPHPNPGSLPPCCRADAADTNAAWNVLVEAHRIPPGNNPEEVSTAKPDSNLWFNPRNVMSAIVTINETLADAAPEAADRFDRRAADLMQDILSLDGWIKARIRDIPMLNRILVSEGESFRYYAQAYGLIAPVGPSDEGLISFSERSSPAALCSCTGCDCEPCPCLTNVVLFKLSSGDDLPSQDSNYGRLMRRNTDIIVETLTATPSQL